MPGARTTLRLVATCALAASAACTADREPTGPATSARLSQIKVSGDVQFGTSADDAAFDIVAGKLGLAIAGATLGSLDGATNAGGRDAFVRLLDARGELLWTNQFGSAVDDAAYAVAMNRAGVYVAGTSFGSLGPSNVGSSDGFVRMLDPNGNIVWSTRLASAGADTAFGLTASDDAVYVTGVLRGSYGGGPIGDADGFVIKLNAQTGEMMWMTRFSGALNGDDGARGVVVDGDAVYVAVTYYGGANGGGPGAEDAAIVRLNSETGAITWYTTAIATAESDVAWDVALDGRTVFLVGAKGSHAFATALFAPTGAIQWFTNLVTSGTEVATTADAGHSTLNVGGWTTGAFPSMTNAGLSDVFHSKIDATTGAILTVDQLGTTAHEAAFGSFLDGKTWNVVGTTAGSLAGASLGGFDAWWMARSAR